MKNVSVQAIQNGLKELGYLMRNVPADGAWSGPTVAGYAEYVRDHNGQPYQEGQPKLPSEIPGPLRDMLEPEPEAASLPAGDTATLGSTATTGTEPSKPAPVGEQIAAGDTATVKQAAPVAAPAPASAATPKAPVTDKREPDGGSESN